MPDRIVISGALAAPLRISERPVPGVNLVGFLEVESGLGEFARRLARALHSTGIPVAAIPYRGTHGRREHPLELAAAEVASYDVNLLSLSADDLVRFGAEVGPRFFANRYSIGVWFWETSVFRSEDRAATRFLDELWVASAYIRNAIAAEVDIPVYVVPVPVEPPPGPVRTRSELGLPDRFTFLFVFDFWSAERKNPAAVVEAFTRAFEPGEGPILVLKSIHGRDWKPRQLARVETLAHGRDDVVIRDGYVSSSERDSYVAACDCYVSLHRSEGLGLTMAEAMALGKPVIATGYSGNLEFMSEANSYLVPYDLLEVPSSWWAYAPGATWAEPDIDAAADLMRRAWEHPDESRALGQRARDPLLERFSPFRTVEFIEGRLKKVRTRGAISARASIHDARPAILEASQELAKDVGASLAEARGALPTSLVRRVLRRALWPYFKDRERVDTAVLDAVTALHRSIQALEQRVHQLEGSRRQYEKEAATRCSTPD
jgi:glycosyltransferase involved in cell wall biosynthesis